MLSPANSVSNTQVASDRDDRVMVDVSNSLLPILLIINMQNMFEVTSIAPSANMNTEIMIVIFFFSKSYHFNQSNGKFSEYSLESDGDPCCDAMSTGTQSLLQRSRLVAAKIALAPS